MNSQIQHILGYGMVLILPTLFITFICAMTDDWEFFKFVMVWVHGLIVFSVIISALIMALITT